MRKAYSILYGVGGVAEVVELGTDISWAGLRDVLGWNVTANGDLAGLSRRFSRWASVSCARS